MKPDQTAEIVKWPADPAAQRALIGRAAALLRAGQVVAFPTDTVYGIAADPANEEAVRALYAIKERPPEKAIALLVADRSDLARVSDVDTPWLDTLLDGFWPGALTLVVEARPDAGIATGQPFSTVGLRMPDHLVPLALIMEMGRPLATTSANLSGSPSPLTAQDVEVQIGGRVALVIDCGSCPVGRDSTVLDLTTTPPTIRRAGALSANRLRSVIGEIAT